MDNEEVARIEQFSGFKHENLPFRYLGVPINSKRLKTSECNALVEKMTSRIRCWSTRHLSFAGRSQLINSVLLSIHSYWAHIFILPSSVLDAVNSICRHYLWSGKAVGEKTGHIKWINGPSPLLSAKLLINGNLLTKVASSKRYGPQYF